MQYIYNTFIESDDYKTFKVIDKHIQKDFGLHASASLLMKFNKYNQGIPEHLTVICSY